jgi:hypothetical protein
MLETPRLMILRLVSSLSEGSGSSLSICVEKFGVDLQWMVDPSLVKLVVVVSSRMEPSFGPLPFPSYS